MKSTLKLIRIIFFLIPYIAFTQQDGIEVIEEKFNPLLSDKNKSVGVLIKKDDAVVTISLGNQYLDENKVFNIGSATKTFTAILILQEVEKGNINLYDSISNYLSPIANVDGALTVDQLLSHESGLDEVVGKNILEIFYSQNDSLYNDNLLYQIEPNNPEMIGKFDYCNTNYLLLGKILEKVADQSFFDLVSQRIIMPLHMNNTYPYLYKNIPNLATPYHGEDVSEYLDYRFFANIASSAGSIASTLTDMEKFYTALFESDVLINNESLKLMMESGNDSYGYGLFKTEDNGMKCYGHGGNNIGYGFRNAYNSVTKDIYLLFSNSMSIPSQSLITNDIIAYLHGETIENFEGVDIDKFKGYAGSYLVKEVNLILDIVIEGDKMFLVSAEQGLKSELAQKDESTLYDTMVGVNLTTLKGSTDSLSFEQSGFTTTINKITPEVKIENPK